jgi:hypothetical protein
VAIVLVNTGCPSRLRYDQSDKYPDPYAKPYRDAVPYEELNLQIRKYDTCQEFRDDMLSKYRKFNKRSYYKSNYK